MSISKPKSESTISHIPPKQILYIEIQREKQAELFSNEEEITASLYSLSSSQRREEENLLSKIWNPKQFW